MKILVLPGDGIGPEITEATLAVLDRANALFKLGLEWQHEEIGLPALKKEGTTLPARVMAAARLSVGVILGPLSTYEYPAREKGGINPSAEFRTKLDLYANIRPAKSRLGVGLTGKPVDLVIYRENTEGFYADRNMYSGSGEFMPTEDMALAVRRVTAKCCERIARPAARRSRLHSAQGGGRPPGQRGVGPRRKKPQRGRGRDGEEPGDAPRRSRREGRNPAIRGGRDGEARIASSRCSDILCRLPH